MTPDKIIEWAREAGAGTPESLYGRTDYVVFTQHDLERFAQLVAYHEREACANLEHEAGVYTKYDMAAAIRAREMK